jgi:hypothetical protein
LQNSDKICFFFYFFIFFFVTDWLDDTDLNTMVILGHATAPPIGTTTFASVHIPLPITLHVLLDESINLQHVSISAELWTNLIDCNNHTASQQSGWHAISMDECTHSSTTTMKPIVPDSFRSNHSMTFKCLLDLTLHSLHSTESSFEYTARLKVEDAGGLAVVRHHWLGEDGRPANARIIVTKIPPPHSPNTHEHTRIHIPDIFDVPPHVQFHPINKESSPPSETSPPLLLSGWLSSPNHPSFKLYPPTKPTPTTLPTGPSINLYKKSRSWLNPHFSSTGFWNVVDPYTSTHSMVRAESYYLLWAIPDDLFVVLIPGNATMRTLADFQNDANGSGGGGGGGGRGVIEIIQNVNMSTFEGAKVFVGVGRDPAEMTRVCFELINPVQEPVNGGGSVVVIRPEILDNEKHAAGDKEEVQDDEGDVSFLDYLGWCTWNSFYKDVSAEKIVKQLEGMQRAGLNVGYVLIDDGWQDVDHLERLKTLDAVSFLLFADKLGVSSYAERNVILSGKTCTDVNIVYVCCFYRIQSFQMVSKVSSKT